MLPELCRSVETYLKELHSDWKKVKKDKQTWKEKKLSFQRWKMLTFVQQKGIQALSAKRFTIVGRDRIKLINTL